MTKELAASVLGVQLVVYQYFHTDDAQPSVPTRDQWRCAVTSYRFRRL